MWQAVDRAGIEVGCGWAVTPVGAVWRPVLQKAWAIALANSQEIRGVTRVTPATPPKLEGQRTLGSVESAYLHYAGQAEWCPSSSALASILCWGIYSGGVQGVTV
jgi:hypothetical protein